LGGVGGTGVGAGLAVLVGVEGVEFEAELPVVVFEPEFELLTLVVALPAENGLADPEPQPTMEATAIAAALSLIKTLEENCTLNPRQSKPATD